jgi:hypothetical protein
MVNRESRDDFELLIARSNDLELAHTDTRNWEESPFNWLLNVASATRGAIGRDLVETWARNSGFDTARVAADHHPMLAIQGYRIQVKTSTRWNSGEYRFQQIRDQPYDFLFFFGISRDDIHTWFIPKEVALEHLIGTSGQHTGAGATETFWINVDPDLPPRWLSDFGDQLSDVRNAISHLDAL